MDCWISWSMEKRKIEEIMNFMKKAKEGRHSLKEKLDKAEGQSST